MSVCPCAEEPQARLACKYIKDPRLTDEARGKGAHCRGRATVAECDGGGVFRNRMAAENEATKNKKIKIRHRLKRLENIIKNATINEKRAASTEGRWDGTRK